jgi:hypothetical protein
VRRQDHEVRHLLLQREHPPGGLDQLSASTHAGNLPLQEPLGPIGEVADQEQRQPLASPDQQGHRPGRVTQSRYQDERTVAKDIQRIADAYEKIARWPAPGVPASSMNAFTHLRPMGPREEVP